MILKGWILAAILRKNGVSAAMVAREFGIGVEELVKTLKEGWSLGYEEAKTLLALKKFEFSTLFTWSFQ